MSRRRPLPYFKKLRQRGRVAVWLVDGSYVRTQLDMEFTNFGQHSDFDFIPIDEFWIDQEKHPDEQPLFIEHMAAERRLLRRGVPADQAAEAARRIEKELRVKAGDLRRLMPGGQLPDPHNAHGHLWKKLESGTSVWIVDGRLVRSVFDIDFTLGGHDRVYEFVPEGEVWIDDDLSDAERPYVLLHELHERNLMAHGTTYADAHSAASALELQCRRHPDRLHDALAHEGWE